MNKQRWIVAGLLLGSAMLIGMGLRQQPVQAAPAAGGGSIYVVNVNKVFKGYDKFTRLSEGLKGEIEASENKLRALDNTMKGKAKALSQLTKQEDRDRAEKEIAEMKFEFEKSRRDFQTDFAKKEAAIYRATYAELTDILTKVSEKNGIHLILRLRTEAEEDDPQVVLQMLNRDVVYYHPNLDLTDVVAGMLNKK